MTFTALLELTLKPESVGDADAVIADTLKATRAFDGCEGVDVLKDTADETHVVLLERWASQEADAAYRAWRATPEGKSGLAGLLAGAPRLTTFTAADV